MKEKDRVLHPDYGYGWIVQIYDNCLPGLTEVKVLFDNRPTIKGYDYEIENGRNLIGSQVAKLKVVETSEVMPKYNGRYIGTSAHARRRRYTYDDMLESYVEMCGGDYATAKDMFDDATAMQGGNPADIGNN